MGGWLKPVWWDSLFEREGRGGIPSQPAWLERSPGEESWRVGCSPVRSGCGESCGGRLYKACWELLQVKKQSWL